MSFAPSICDSAVNQIKSYDRALDFEWNRQVKRWELWRRSPNAKNGKVLVVRIENPDGSYRPVDNRIIKYLVNNDTWKHKNATQQARDMAYYEQRQREKEERNYEQRLIDIGLDSRLQRLYQEQYG